MKIWHRTIVTAGAVLIGTFAGAPQALLAAPAKPNIIFILADDLGWADLNFQPLSHAQPHGWAAWWISHRPLDR